MKELAEAIQAGVTSDKEYSKEKKIEANSLYESDDESSYDSYEHGDDGSPWAKPRGPKYPKAVEEIDNGMRGIV